MVLGSRIVEKRKKGVGKQKNWRRGIAFKNEEMVLSRGLENTVFAELTIKGGQIEVWTEEIQFHWFGGNICS